MINFDKKMYGRQVQFINAEAHEEMPWCYPEVGTIGIIVPVEGTAFERLVDDFAVQWPKGSTSGNDCWLVDDENLELVEEVQKRKLFRDKTHLTKTR